MPADPLRHAATVQRRWRGVGPLLFIVFYSVFFAAHLKLERSLVYMQNDAVLAVDTAAFYHDMTASRAEAGSSGMGQGNAFVLLHHEPLRLLIAAWSYGSENESIARRHGVATLTAGAGALLVMFFYLALMWAGVARLRAVLLACTLGCTTAVLLFSVLPQPYIFGAMGFMAALAAVVRGQSGRWWEFTVAALYTVCCSFWHIIPLLGLALIRGVQASLGSAGARPVIQALVSVVLLAGVALGAVKLQQMAYPATATEPPAHIAQGVVAGLGQAGRRTPQVDWRAKAPEVFLANVVAPLPAAEPAPRKRAFSLPAMDERWFVPDIKSPARTAWLVVLVAGLIGLPLAFRNWAAAVAGLLVGGWFVWLDGVQAVPDTPLLHAVLWTPAVLFLVGLGLEQYPARVSYLRWPVTVLLAAFLVLAARHNAQLLLEIARRVAV